MGVKLCTIGVKSRKIGGRNIWKPPKYFKYVYYFIIDFATSKVLKKKFSGNLMCKIPINIIANLKFRPIPNI